MGSWSIGLLCFKVFVVIEIESIAHSPWNSPPFFFLYWFNPRAFKDRKKMHFTFWWEVITLYFRQRGETELLFSVSEAYFSKRWQKITGLGRKPKHLCNVVWHEWTWIHILNTRWSSQLTPDKPATEERKIFLSYSVGVDNTDNIFYQCNGVGMHDFG